MERRREGGKRRSWREEKRGMRGREEGRESIDRGQWRGEYTWRNMKQLW